jgi:hypothetical protein
VRALHAQLVAERAVMPAFAEEIYTLFKGTGAEMIGHWPTDGYQHEDSKVTHDIYEPPNAQLCRCLESAPAVQRQACSTGNDGREHRQQYTCTQSAHCILQALINGGSHFCGLLLDEVPSCQHVQPDAALP